MKIIMTIRIVFDKDTEDKNLIGGWGITYLVDNSLLFDTGEKGEYIINNFKILNVDINKIDNIFISHNHWDHLRGLEDLLKIISNKVKIWVCTDIFDELKNFNYNLIKVDNFEKIKERIYTTGCFKINYKGRVIFEQALILETEKGLSIICGCAHMGVLQLIAKVKELFPKNNIYSFIGGVHLIDTDNRLIEYIVEEIAKLGIERFYLGHCTGYQAITLFKHIYKGRAKNIYVGMEIEV
ncbi:MAG: MBL fold metallo-hydrolase [Candidatus Omnitrophica bacterium]|nr:MBL fold metallo-hydrolase [Candidatus Omnitrophota bacterium]